MKEMVSIDSFKGRVQSEHLGTEPKIKTRGSQKRCCAPRLLAQQQQSGGCHSNKVCALYTSHQVGWQLEKTQPTTTCFRPGQKKKMDRRSAHTQTDQLLHLSSNNSLATTTTAMTTTFTSAKANQVVSLITAMPLLLNKLV